MKIRPKKALAKVLSVSRAMLGGAFLLTAISGAHAHAQTCSDLFQTADLEPVGTTSLWSGVRNAGIALYGRLRRSKVEAAFESSFTSSERRALREFADGVMRPEMRSRESQAPFFLYILFSETPAATRSALSRVLDSKLPFPSSGSRSEGIEKAYDLFARVSGSSIRSGSFLETVLENWIYDTRSDFRSLARWMTDLETLYRKRESEGEFAKAQFHESLNSSRLRVAASEHWRETVSLSRLGIDADTVGSEIFLDGHHLGSVVGIEGNVAILRVPRARIKRAAWNPLSSEVLRKKIEDGFPKVRAYEAFLAADGYFYLLDGNHRFYLDDRQEVSIKISRPIAISSLSTTLDAMGVPQPKIENLVLYHQGKLALENLIGEDVAKSLILAERP